MRSFFKYVSHNLACAVTFKVKTLDSGLELILILYKKGCFIVQRIEYSTFVESAFLLIGCIQVEATHALYWDFYNRRIRASVV